MKKIKRKLISELAKMSVKAAHLTDSELLKAFEETLTLSKEAIFAYDDKAESLLKPVYKLIRDEIDNRICPPNCNYVNHEFDNEFLDILYNVEAQYSDHMRIRYFNEIIIDVYATNPDAFDAAIEQMEKDAATVDNGLSFDLQAHSDTVEAATVVSDESIFPDPADIEPNMIVPTLAQAVEWRPALSNIDLTAAYQLAVLTHSKMTILTKDRWLVEECLNAFEEEARNRGVNILPLDTIGRFKFNLQSHADDETEKALDYIVDGVAQSYFKLKHIEEGGVDTHCDPSNKLAALNVIHMHAMYKFAVKHGEIALADQYLYQIDRFLKVIGIDRVNTKTNRFKFDLQRHAAPSKPTKKARRSELLAVVQSLFKHFGALNDGEIVEMFDFCNLTILKLNQDSDDSADTRAIKIELNKLSHALCSAYFSRRLYENADFASKWQAILDRYADIYQAQIAQLALQIKASEYAQNLKK